jgi:phosphatidylglycerophosphatase A
MKRKVIIALSSLCGAGYAPFASGTVGTAATIPLLLLFLLLDPVTGGLVIVAAILLGCYLGVEAEKIYSDKDPGEFVFDEAVGYLVTCYGFAGEPTWLVVLLGFFLFRFFDVAKLAPASYFDRRVENGVGVMLDDVMAGLYANLALRLIFLLF